MAPAAEAGVQHSGLESLLMEGGENECLLSLVPLDMS